MAARSVLTPVIGDCIVDVRIAKWQAKKSLQKCSPFSDNKGRCNRV